MFDNKQFEEWLEVEATKAMKKITQGQATTPNEMMMLVLKAQTNHIAHMETDLRGEMIALRKDMDKRFEEAKIEIQMRFEEAKIETQRRFEQVDKRFDTVLNRIDSFMKWSFSTTLMVGGLVIAVMQYSS